MRKYLIAPFDLFTGSVIFGQLETMTHGGHENAADETMYRMIRRRHGVTDEYPLYGAAGIVVDGLKKQGTLWFLATPKYAGVHTYCDYLFGIHEAGGGYISVLMLGTPVLLMKTCLDGKTTCTSMPQKRMDDHLSLSAFGVAGNTYEECHKATLKKIDSLHCEP